MPATATIPTLTVVMDAGTDTELWSPALADNLHVSALVLFNKTLKMFSFFSITSLAQSIAMDETAYFQCSANRYSTLGLQCTLSYVALLSAQYTAHGLTGSHPVS